LLPDDHHAQTRLHTLSLQHVVHRHARRHRSLWLHTHRHAQAHWPLSIANAHHNFASHVFFRTGERLFRTNMSATTFKPNDTGIDLKDIAAPSIDGAEAPPPADGEPEAAEPPVDPETMMRAQAIQSEDRVARRQLIMTIQKYYSSTRFGPYLHKMELVEELGLLTIPEMTALLQDIKFTIQNKTTGEMIQRGVPQLICAAEPLVSEFYDIKGLSNVLIASESFKDLLEEVALESQAFSNTPASTRLFYEVAKTALFVHEARDAQKKAAAAKEKEKEIKVSANTADLIS
jgi:hypothetical protein